MKAYIVTYDFKITETDVSDLAEAIKSFGLWWHYLKHSWIIKTDKTAQEVFEELKLYMKPGMNILIFELGTDRYGWLPKDSWDWIKETVPKDRR